MRSGATSTGQASRGPSWIPRGARELLTTEPEELAAFLRHHLAEEPPVTLGVINGPAGPLYNVSSGGAHTHLFRILGLPWMIAKLYARIPPRRFDVACVIDTAKGMTEIERAGRGWHTLLERGLLHGRIRYEGAFAVLDLDHAPRPGCSATPPSPAPTTRPTNACTLARSANWASPPPPWPARKAWEQWLYG